MDLYHMLENPYSLWCTAILCGAMSMSCSKPLNWMLIDWIKSSILPFPLLYQLPFLLYSLFPPALLFSFLYSISISQFFKYHLHQNFIFYLASGKVIGYLCTAVSHWLWVVLLLVLAKVPWEASAEMLDLPATAWKGYIQQLTSSGSCSHLSYTGGQKEKNTTMYLKLCAENFIFKNKRLEENYRNNLNDYYPVPFWFTFF